MANEQQPDPPAKTDDKQREEEGFFGSPLPNPAPVIMRAPSGDVTFTLGELNFEIRSERSCLALEIKNNDERTLRIKRISPSQCERLTLVAGQDMRLRELEEKSARIRESLSEVILRMLGKQDLPEPGGRELLAYLAEERKREIREVLRETLPRQRTWCFWAHPARLLSGRISRAVDRVIKRRGAFPFISCYEEALAVSKLIPADAKHPYCMAVLETNMSQLKSIEIKINALKDNIVISPGKSARINYIVDMEKRWLNDVKLQFTLECIYSFLGPAPAEGAPPGEEDAAKPKEPEPQPQPEDKTGQEAENTPQGSPPPPEPARSAAETPAIRDGATEPGAGTDVRGINTGGQAGDGDEDDKYFTLTISRQMSASSVTFVANCIVIFTALATQCFSRPSPEHMYYIAPNASAIWALLYSALLDFGTHAVSWEGVKTVIVSLALFSIYERTPLWHKLNLGINWRSAMIVGVFCGIFTDRLLAWFKSILSFGG